VARTSRPPQLPTVEEDGTGGVRAGTVGHHGGGAPVRGMHGRQVEEDFIPCASLVPGRHGAGAFARGSLRQDLPSYTGG
jgi:hypothetical protein